MVVALLTTIVVVALLAATPAWASSPSNVSVTLLPAPGDLSENTHNLAGQPAHYRIAFTAGDRLVGQDLFGDFITISAPDGTVFYPGQAAGYNLYTLSYPGRTYEIPDRNVKLSDGDSGSTVTIYLERNDVIEGGDRVIIDVLYVDNPKVPGTYTLTVSTSQDVPLGGADSNPYTILPRLVGGPPPVPEVPTSKEQCKKGGYEAFDFKNQGQCVAFVQRGPKNKGGEASS